MRQELEAALKAWPKSGHLVLAMLDYGVEASELIGLLDTEGSNDREAQLLYERCRAAHRAKLQEPLTLREADDLEVALFFELWPNERHSWVSTIAAVNEKLVNRFGRRFRWEHLKRRIHRADGLPLEQLFRDGLDTLSDMVRDRTILGFLERPDRYMSLSGSSLREVNLPVPSTVRQLATPADVPQPQRLPEPSMVMEALFRGVRTGS